MSTSYVTSLVKISVIVVGFSPKLEPGGTLSENIRYINFNENLINRPGVVIFKNLMFYLTFADMGLSEFLTWRQKTHTMAPVFNPLLVLVKTSI
jgi:hypothetical protein